MTVEKRSVDTFGRDALVGISEKEELRAKAKASIVRKRQARARDRIRQSAERSRLSTLRAGSSAWP